MALYDAMFEFCDDDSVFSNGTTVQSENILDMQTADLEMGAGQPVWLNIRVGTTAFTGGTSVQFALVSDSDTTITNGTTIIETGAITVATLIAGYWVLRVSLPVRFDTDRYIGLVVTCVGNVTAGSINAWLDNGSQSSYNTQVSASNI